MKKLSTLLFVLLLSSLLFARITLTCDVIREKSFAEWSDYYRCKVEFVTGHEMKYSFAENKLYAIIWYSQTQCSIIEMEYDGILLKDKTDAYFMFLYFGFDLLNEGKMGIEKNGDKETKWRIYGKDEDASMIDPIFNRHPYNYHEVVEEQRRNGTLKKRKRPQEETKYAGMDKGTVIWNEDPFYIIQSDKRYIVAIRITLYYWSGTVTNNDLLMGDFKEEGEISIDNITRNETGFHVKIVHIGNDLQSCQDWLNENIFNNQ